MLKLVSIFTKIPVISIYNSKKVGEVATYIVDPKIGKIIGAIVGKYGLILKKNILVSEADIREISPKALVVDSEECLVKQREIVKLDKILRSGKKVIGAKVFSKEGNYLGKVYDYLVDEFFFIRKIYIYPPFFNIFDNQLILSRENIIEIRKDGIIIDDSKNRVIKEPKALKTNP